MAAKPAAVACTQHVCTWTKRQPHAHTINAVLCEHVCSRPVRATSNTLARPWELASWDTWLWGSGMLGGAGLQRGWVPDPERHGPGCAGGPAGRRARQRRRVLGGVLPHAHARGGLPGALAPQGQNRVACCLASGPGSLATAQEAVAAAQACATRATWQASHRAAGVTRPQSKDSKAARGDSRPHPKTAFAEAPMYRRAQTVVC